MAAVADALGYDRRKVVDALRQAEELAAQRQAMAGLEGNPALLALARGFARDDPVREQYWTPRAKPWRLADGLRGAAEDQRAPAHGDDCGRHLWRNAPSMTGTQESFRDLFCRRCCVYDCRQHGISQPLPKHRSDPPQGAPVPLDFLAKETNAGPESSPLTSASASAATAATSAALPTGVPSPEQAEGQGEGGSQSRTNGIVSQTARGGEAARNTKGATDARMQRGAVVPSPSPSPSPTGSASGSGSPRQPGRPHRSSGGQHSATGGASSAQRRETPPSTRLSGASEPVGSTATPAAAASASAALCQGGVPDCAVPQTFTAPGVAVYARIGPPAPQAAAAAASGRTGSAPNPPPLGIPPAVQMEAPRTHKDVVVAREEAALVAPTQGRRHRVPLHRGAEACTFACTGPCSTACFAWALLEEMGKAEALTLAREGGGRVGDSRPAWKPVPRPPAGAARRAPVQGEAAAGGGSGSPLAQGERNVLEKARAVSGRPFDCCLLAQWLGTRRCDEVWHALGGLPATPGAMKRAVAAWWSAHCGHIKRRGDAVGRAPHGNAEAGSLPEAGAAACAAAEQGGSAEGGGEEAASGGPPRRRRNSRKRGLYADTMRRQIMHRSKRRRYQHEYTPCVHKGPCTPDVCRCARLGVFCEKYCGCSPGCSRAHLGCRCKKVRAPARRNSSPGETPTGSHLSPQLLRSPELLPHDGVPLLCYWPRMRPGAVQLLRCVVPRTSLPPPARRPR